MQNGTKTGVWYTHDQNESIPGGPMAGPVILFNGSGTAAVVLGYFENFLTGMHRQNAGVLEFGLLGSITSIPAGYTSSMVVVSNDGINAAVEAYGAALLTKYDKPGRQWDYLMEDITIQKLGYYTDK